MNKVILIGRCTRDPEVRYSQGENATAVARYTLAVDRQFKRDGDQSADFINCIAFGKRGEFAEKYLRKGTKIAVVGRIQTGSYTNKDGQKVYTTDVIVDEHEFVESKASQQNGGDSAPVSSDGFMSIPDGVDAKVRPLTFDEARKYNDLLVNKDLPDWYWTCTAWSTEERGWGNSVAVVSPSGYVSLNRYYYGRGVRPFCILKSNIFVSKVTEE